MGSCQVGENGILFLVEKRKNKFYRLPTKSPFFGGKNFGGTRHPCEKNEPTLDHSGGVHGKACWLIAYIHTNT